jgi:hypothetical protein
MTNNIYPPDHLLRKWESLIIDEDQNVDVVLYEAFQAGADQELQACCEWLVSEPWFKYEHEAVEDLRAARRPKPPSLKELALAVLENEPEADDMKELVVFDVDQVEIIRRALEALPDD